jgi:DNA-binding transcriptional ArsR family regulator
MGGPAGKRTGQRKKKIEEVIAYALGHRTRIQVLLLLNEGTYTAGEIAQIIDVPLNNVANHIHELLEAGSIELADSKRRRNAVQNWYRAVDTPYYSDEVMEKMRRRPRRHPGGDRPGRLRGPTRWRLTATAAAGPLTRGLPPTTFTLDSE